jgi:PIN domain nuclease of toxin-antitoxin system
MGDRAVTVVLDTHTWLWWVSAPGELGRGAAGRLRRARRILVSAISCLEVAMAAARGRISLDRGLLEWLEQAAALPRVELVPLTPSVAVAAAQLGRSFPGDPADRVIVATALLEGAVLLTKDSQLRDRPPLVTAW